MDRSWDGLGLDDYVRRKAVVSQTTKGRVCPPSEEGDHSCLEQGGPSLGPCRPRTSQGGWNGQQRGHHKRTQS